VPTEAPPTVLHFKSQSLHARVENSIAIIDLEQVFVNELESTVEATYQFPADPDSVVSRVRIELGDKVVEGKVHSKEKAQEKYDDALAGGHAAVMVQEDEKDKDLLKMNIGGI
jgi:Ca-activated chloride channel homolog